MKKSLVCLLLFSNSVFANNQGQELFSSLGQESSVFNQFSQDELLALGYELKKDKERKESEKKANELATSNSSNNINETVRTANSNIKEEDRSVISIPQLPQLETKSPKTDIQENVTATNNSTVSFSNTPSQDFGNANTVQEISENDLDRFFKNEQEQYLNNQQNERVKNEKARVENLSVVSQEDSTFSEKDELSQNPSFTGESSVKEVKDAEISFANRTSNEESSIFSLKENEDWAKFLTEEEKIEIEEKNNRVATKENVGRIFDLNSSQLQEELLLDSESIKKLLVFSETHTEEESARYEQELIENVKKQSAANKAKTNSNTKPKESDNLGSKTSLASVVSNNKASFSNNKQISAEIANDIAVSVSAKGKTTCWDEAGRYHKIDPWLLRAIAVVESSLDPNAIRQNTNDTTDIGIMQINDKVWLPSLSKHGITKKMLKNPCVAIYAGAWILRQHFNEFGYTAKAIGVYHSRTPHLRDSYAKKVYRTYNKLVSDFYKKNGKK